ncbi:hypothetical protein Y1Q_0019917 [Alligator mississippiensis]|nr:hypothetical protein Y1Q_0019917 [Alligator mississippiensis]
MSQANGTNVLPGSEAGHSPADSDRTSEEHQAAFSLTPVDSPNSSLETPVDSTGDITVEEVKDFLASTEEAEKSLRILSEEDARLLGILIK